MNLQTPTIIRILVILCLFPFLSLAQKPAIANFYPTAGYIGSTVTITGTNFNSTAAENIVYFGPVRANVLTGGSNAITVEVPPSARYGKITVTNKSTRLTGASSLAFIPTFPGGDQNLYPVSFGEEIIQTGFTVAGNIEIADFDTDGKPDILGVSRKYSSGYYLTFLRNTSKNNSLTFSAILDDTYHGYAGLKTGVGDLNGDGRLDIISAEPGNLSQGDLYIHKNISSPGEIKFTRGVRLEAIGVTREYEWGISDLDGDGRQDVILFIGSDLSVMRNISTGDSIVLAPPVPIVRPGRFVNHGSVKIADFDENGKPDLLATYGVIDSIFVVSNQSSPGNFSFVVNKIKAETYASPSLLEIGDLNYDGKLDFAVYLGGYLGRLSTYKNMSSPGNVMFTEMDGFVDLWRSSGNPMGDINGDGKVDILLTHLGHDIIRIGNNSSIVCKRSFSNSGEIFSRNLAGVLLTDMDGDGKPELVRGEYAYDQLVIRKNYVAQSLPVCTGGNITLPSSHFGTNYQWQRYENGSYVNIADDGVVSGTHSSELRFANVPVAFDGLYYRCLVDSDTSNGIQLRVYDAVTPSVAVSSCMSSVCIGSPGSILYATVTNGGASPAYQWQENADASGWKDIAGATNDTLWYTVTLNGAKVRCVVASSLSCASSNIVTSNEVTLGLTQTTTVSAAISGNTSVLPGQTSTLTASVSNGGISPVFKWQDSTDFSGWRDLAGVMELSIGYKPAKSGDKVRFVIYSSAVCPTPLPKYSNSLTFTIGNVTAVNPEPVRNFAIRIYPNPVIANLRIENLSLGDRWDRLEIFTLNGSKVRAVSLLGVTAKAIDLGGLAGGGYIVVFVSRSGQRAFYKIIKEGR
jgi:hypothetical protein